MMPTFSNANDKTAITAISVKILFFLMKSIMHINNLCIMDFIKKNKILTLMAVIAVLSFALEKVGIIHP